MKKIPFVIDAIEYGLLVLLISSAIIGVLKVIGTAAGGIYVAISNVLVGPG